MNADLKNGTCPIHGRLCYPAIAESAKICAEFRQKYKQRGAEQKEQLEFSIMLNSLITAIAVFVMMLILLPVGGEVFFVSLVVALLPISLYKMERGVENARQ